MKIKIAAAVLLLCCGTAFGNQVYTQPSIQFREDPAAAPLRIIENTLYNLNESTQGWASVTAKYLKPHLYSGGWVATGQLRGSNYTFILLHPPKEAYQQFSEYKAEYDRLLAEYNQLMREYQDIRIEYDQNRLALSEVQADNAYRYGVWRYRDQRDWWDLMDEGYYIASEANVVRDRMIVIYDFLDKLQRESGFDLSGGFVFSVHAMPLPDPVDGLPVYDRGLIR